MENSLKRLCARNKWLGLEARLATGVAADVLQLILSENLGKLRCFEFLDDEENCSTSVKNPLKNRIVKSSLRLKIL